MWKVLIIISGNVGCFLIVTTMVDMNLMGKLVHKKSKKCPGREFVIKQSNKIDIQTGYQCAAYSVAYLLRHYGIPANGSDIYTMIPDKMKNGCTYPKGIVHILQEYGFDEQYIFIAESLSEMANYDGKLYNRRIEKEEFVRFWNTSMLRQPLYRNTFFAVQKDEN